jgi:hypothetical protein
MEKKQTAMQWLIEKIEDESVTPDQIEEEWLIIREQALQMEREQIEEAYWDGGQDIPMSEQSCKEYYKKTFKL